MFSIRAVRKKISDVSIRNYLLLGVGFACLVSAAGLIFFADHIRTANSAFASLTNPDATEHVVTLTEDGFVPNDLVIRKGEKVIFNTELNEPYWPASSLHPDHTIYPEFDAKERIIPPENWEFVFTKPGVWRYHDHLAPNFGGVITVLDPYQQDAMLASASNKECLQLSGSEKLQCLDVALEKILRTEGITAAFDFFVEIYHADPEVPQVCHGWTHRLGEVGYERYKAGEDIELRPEATFCSYGYFHGFISAMITDTQSITSALDFCTDVVNELGDQLNGLHNNCVHGVGHGITTIAQEDPENWGRFQKSADQGIALCQELYAEEWNLNICVDGMFHELHMAILNNQYGMRMEDYTDTNDMFYYCKQQEDRFKGPCYYDFITLWPYFFGDDKKAAVEYVFDTMVEPEKNAPRALQTFARSFIEVDIVHGDYQESMEACRLVPSYLFEGCIRGLASGFTEHGEPNNMHEEGFSFCRSGYMTPEEYRICITSMVGMLSHQYSPELLAQACSALRDDETVWAGEWCSQG